MTTHRAVIIGAGPAGLASAACLKRRGVEPIVLERGRAVGATWRHHYDRLHLHTNNRLSHLPYLRFPPGVGRYPSRRQVVAYLESYAEHHGIVPRFEAAVTGVARDGAVWRVTHAGGCITARNVVIATGYTGEPVLPRWSGQETFPGDIVHSAHYRSGLPYAGKRVLVVGLGNSGGEIALDLAEHGANPTLSVRGPVTIIPREILGVPILAISIPLSRLPPRLADALSAPLLRVLIGRYERLGLRRSATGPFRQIVDHSRIPLIDIGTVALIRRGDARVRPAIDRFERSLVRFTNGSRDEFDAVVAATGFRPSFETFLALPCGRPPGEPIAWQSPEPGLYFCGFRVSPTGMLREIGIEARRIAAAVARGA